MEQQATVRSDYCRADSLHEASENHNAEGCVACEGPATEATEAPDGTGWRKGHHCYLVAKSLASLCPCPGRLNFKVMSQST